MLTGLDSSNLMQVPFEQQAPCYFVSNFVLTPRHAVRGHCDFLLPMLKNESPTSAISLAFQAVAMGAMSNKPNFRGRVWSGQVIAQYIKALKATNLALQNPAKQKSDQTLAAVLMLGMFEVCILCGWQEDADSKQNIASEKSASLAWYSHIEGAVQLVKLRGKKQLRTKIGHSLFASVRTQMVSQAELLQYQELLTLN